MISLPFQLRFSLGPLLLATSAIGLYVAEPLSSQWLEFFRYAVDSYETWRLVTASLVHTNGFHVLLNLGGLALLWALHGEYYRPLQFIKMFLLCALAVGLGVYFLSPEMIAYAGMSGALHGLFILGAAIDIQRKEPTGWILMLGCIAKIVYEQFAGGNGAVAELIDASVAVDAHLYGAIGGLLVFIIAFPKRKVTA